MIRKMTGPEHARAALEALAEAKMLTGMADKQTTPEYRAAYSAQASACADVATAAFHAAHLALQVIGTPMAGLNPHQVKEWRDIMGVV